MNRREFVALGAMAAGARTLPAQAPANVMLKFSRPEKPIVVPEDFIGLGYETSSPARLGLLSVKNLTYLNLVRGLGPQGTLRFGGIVGDYTKYDPDGTPKTEITDTVMTRAAIQQAAEFLRATGWRAIWVVNFGSGTLENAVAEARDIAAILGDRLLAIEIGNEVEEYGKSTHHRPADWEYAKYRAEYATWHKAIHEAVPGVKFMAPDTAGSVEWVEEMAADNAGTVQMLATHYYRGSQKLAQPDQIRSVDPALEKRVARLRAASEKSGLPWHICETNSFYGGGHPGLSNTLLGALWTLDYMLYLASNGCAGVNLETGINQLGFVSSYSPIQDDLNGHNSAGVPYYGMLAANVALSHGRNVFAIELPGAAPTLTAYGFGTGSLSAITIINRDATQDVEVNVGAGGEWIKSDLLQDSDGVTFDLHAVNAQGFWQLSDDVDIVRDKVSLPHMTAVVLRR